MSKPYISRLSQEFYNTYDDKNYPEILHKPDRPYVVLIARIDGNTFAIPFRTNIRHNACYKFKHSSRKTENVTGLDYSKAVIVNDPKYIGAPTTIDNSEYVELNSRRYFIIKQFTAYVNGYRKFAEGKSNPYEAKKYLFTTLKYYHSELGIASRTVTAL